MKTATNSKIPLGKLGTTGKLVSCINLNGAHIGKPDITLKSKKVSAEDCMRYELSPQVSVRITGVDSQDILDQACRVAETFKPMTQAAVLRASASPGKASQKVYAN